MSDPVQLFSFSDWQSNHPNDQPPGDRLDAEFNSHRVAIVDVETKLNDVRRSDGKLKNGIVTQDALDPTAFDAIETAVITAVTPLVTSAGGSSLAAQASALAASTSAAGAESARLAAEAAANILATDASGALAQIGAAHASALTLQNTAENLAADVINDAHDAEGWGAYSYSWAQVSWRWAEYMEGPIPSDILAIMGIAGDHWSSRFWATAAADAAGDSDGSAAAAAAAAAAAQAAAEAAADAAQDAADAVAELGDFYLGAHPSAPTMDNQGDPLKEGALYFNSTTDQLYVWDGDSWNAVTTPSGSGVSASDVIFAPVGDLSSTNVQAALAEVDAEKVEEAPTDGGTYGRQNGAWTSVVTPTVAWGDITGKPATFPPSAHTHPTSEITGLDAALADRATDAELAAEVSARTTADTTLQGNINAEASARAAADTTLQTNIDGKLSLTGGTMLGPIVLSGAPSTGLHPATKTYTDAADTTLQGNITAEQSARIAADALLQPLDATLTALAALNATGFLRMTAAGTAVDTLDPATSAEYRANTAGKASNPLNLGNVWAAAAFVAVPYASSVALDMTTGINFSTLAVTGPITLANPTVFGPAGRCGSFVLQAAADQTLAFGSQWLFPGGTKPTLLQAGKPTAIFYEILSGTQLLCSAAEAYA